MKGVDKILFWLTVALTVGGVVAVADASAPQALSVFNDAYYFAKQQAMWAVIGIVGMMVAATIPYKFWQKTAYITFGVSVALLIVVLLPHVGSRLLGARRWISLGFLSFQPSEIVKLTIAIFMARILSEERQYWLYLLVLGGVAGLIMLQPDLGTTIVVVGVGAAELFLVNTPLLYLGGTGIVGLVGGGLIILLSGYRKQRLMTFFESSQDPLGTSYHIRQILIALGSGGLFGVGLGQSRQKYLFLPETATDSVFAVIGEEIGFVGAVFLMAVLFFFVLRALKIASRAPDKFSKLLAGGITAWLGGQVFLNIASMIALTPLTGIPLPFFSYGGSSLLMILVSVGILLSISRETHEKK